LAYNTSKGVVIRNRVYLDRMANTTESITFPSDSPDKLAYRIREARYAAARYPEFRKYHDLRYLFNIIARSGWVECRFLGTANDVQPITLEGKLVEEVREIHGVVGACIKFGAEADELTFPNAILQPKELDMLYKWGQKEGWGLIYHDEEGITLTRRNVDKEFLWEPT
jgi:hypothetical protein